MRLAHRLIAAPLMIVLLLYPCGVALAAQTARLHVSLSPERLGQPTTIAFGFEISSTSGGRPVPMTNVGVLLPSEMGIATSGLGLENCRPLRLERIGPEGCPPNALMGRGVATAKVPIGAVTIVESAQVELFSSPVVDGHLAILVYANASTPVSAQLVFPAMVLPAHSPFGENIDTDLPLVPSLPAGPDVAITRFHATLGSPPGRGRFLYEKSVHGRRVSFAPRGLILPPACPRGGFTFQAEFEFQDGEHVVARSIVRCPHAAAHARQR
jgi:hypothetical protein